MRVYHVESLLAVRLSDLTHELGPAHVHSAVDLTGLRSCIVFEDFHQRLLQRTTRALAITEAGQRFFEHCVATVEGAQAAYNSVAELRREPAGLVRLCSRSCWRKGVSRIYSLAI